MKSTRSTDRVTSHGVAVTPPSSTAPTLDCPLGTVVNLSPSYINSIKLVFHARSVSGDINPPPPAGAVVTLCRGRDKFRTNCMRAEPSLHGLVRRCLVRQAPTRLSTLRGGAPMALPEDLLPPLPVRLCRAPQHEPPAPGSRPIYSS